MTQQLPQGSFHTIVIGAGPGGLACATLLAQHGKEVLVLERHREVGPKVCAGGLTRSGLAERLPAELIERSFFDQQIFSSWQKITIEAPTPIVSTVNRHRLGQWMLGQAVRAGVQVMTGTRALTIGEKEVTTTAGKFSYRYLVGADGSSSLVRQAIGLKTALLGTGLQFQLQGKFDRMEWHLDPSLFRNGYAWVFPHRQTASVGAYACRGGLKPGRLLHSLRLWSRRQGLELGPARLQAALINFDYRGWRFGNRFLVGDAAGLASGLTGEGIYPAILSGETVAQTIIDSRHHSLQMEGLIHRHRRHRKVLGLIGRRLACRLSMEAFVFALRTGLIGFNALEMGD